MFLTWIKKVRLMIQAVTFDLWGTLIVAHEGYDRSVKNKRADLVYEALKGKVSREEVSKALEQSWSHIENFRSTLRDVPTNKQVQILQSLLHVECDLEKPYTEAILSDLPEINPYVEEVLTQLETKTGIISNTGATPGKVLRIVLDKMGILKFFDLTLFSNEVGYLKPHPEIFLHASEALGVSPPRMLHVGDDVKTDIEGARQVGMQTLLVKEPADVKKVLELI